MRWDINACFLYILPMFLCLLWKFVVSKTHAMHLQHYTSHSIKSDGRKKTGTILNRGLLVINYLICSFLVAVPHHVVVSLSYEKQYVSS